MKRVLIAIAAILMMAGCSNTAEYNGNLTGQWAVYKLTYNNLDQSPSIGSLADSILGDHYRITFTADGKYIEQYNNRPAANDTVLYDRYLVISEG